MTHGNADRRGPDLLKSDEAAQMLRCSDKTLANKRSRGEGPPYIRMPGGGIRYSRSAVVAWLEANTVTPGAA